VNKTLDIQTTQEKRDLPYSHNNELTDTPPDTNKGQATPALKLLYTSAMMHPKERGSRIPPIHSATYENTSADNQLSAEAHGTSDDKTQTLAKIHTSNTFEGLAVVLLQN